MPYRDKPPDSLQTAMKWNSEKQVEQPAVKGKPFGRVLMLVENNSYSRDPRVRKESRALKDAGYSVSVISPAEPEQALHELIDGVNVYRYPAPPHASGTFSYMFEYAYSMALIFILSLWVCIRHGFDVIHAANPPDTLVFLAAPYKLFGKRFVFDHHDLAPEMYYARFRQHGNPWVYKILLWCEALSCRLADHVFATNESHKAIEISRDGRQGDKITIVRNGPDLTTSWTAAPDPELRARAGTIIAYAGIIGVQDGVDYLLRALHHLIVTLDKKNVLCLIIGDGDALAELKRQAEELAIADYIVFAGWIEDPHRYARYISTADICVDPSPSTPYNDRCTTIKIMEYMASAKPIVAFDLPEHHLSAENSAIYAFPNDELSLARAIAELMDDEPRRRTMGMLGRRRVEQTLAWSYSAANMLSAYSDLFSRPSRKSIRMSASSSRLTDPHTP
jgi:glycosyltransferase involved in cell wall biosynthesis